ncbi:hypothetical protein KS419_20745 [Bacillus tamaricis]|uniref:Uncharacterized protein n=1 Tax=Evansella tamaricis TaxID=2069301 RepID=A0ABS6JKF5_9BACI|nr:hypothetical protein [Evansella tamaricis]MBU9714169.1 hypothetical protein [Evansella tamaricis]
MAMMRTRVISNGLKEREVKAESFLSAGNNSPPLSFSTEREIYYVLTDSPLSSNEAKWSNRFGKIGWNHV